MLALLLPCLSYVEQQQRQQQASAALTPADAPRSRFAWVSSLCGDATYVPAAAVLAAAVPAAVLAVPAAVLAVPAHRRRDRK